MPSKLRIVYEDNHLLVINKPAGLSSQGSMAGEPSLVESVKHYLKEKYSKPGNVYVGIVSRLDSFVSGLIVVARTSKAAARLNKQFVEGSVTKKYWALIPKVDNFPLNDEIQNHIFKDDEAHRMRISRTATKDSQVARMRYRTLATAGIIRLIEIELLTGRKHQIRAQLAELGAPIIGDRKYDSKEAFESGIALHSHFLCVEHPTLKEVLSFQVEPPNYWHLERFSLN